MAGWLYRRFRRWFVLVIVLQVVLVTLLVVGLPVIVLGCLLTGLTVADMVDLFLLGAFVFAVATVGALPWALASVRPLSAWLRGAPVDPALAWEAAQQAPRLAVDRGAIVVAPFLLLLSDRFFGTRAALSGTGRVGVAAMTLLVISAAYLFTVVGYEVSLRPVKEEIAAQTPVRGVRRSWGLTRKLTIGTILTIALGGFGVAAVASRTDSVDARVLAVPLASVGVAAYFGFLYWSHIAQPALRPLRDLTEATSRVERGDYTQRVPVTSADELGDLVDGFNSMQRGLQERAALHAAFGTYVDPALAQRLIDSGSSLFAGEDLVVTVLFADVRDFTSYSEGIAPADAVALLNRLFDVIVPVLHEHRGHANHYLGDGLLAVFGAPQPLQRHPDAAVTAAVEMQQRVRAEFGPSLRLGIGINTGSVIAGTVGGGGRHEFTVIGDTVNTAARVEQLTKETGDAILITEATRTALSTPRPKSATRGAFDLRGKAARVSVHAVNPFP